jgi:hypothetical protein
VFKKEKLTASVAGGAVTVFQVIFKWKVELELKVGSTVTVVGGRKLVPTGPLVAEKTS